MAQGRFAKLEKSQSAPAAPSSTAAAPKPVRAPQTPYDGPEAYPTFIEEAEKAFFTGNYRDALRHYSRALQEDNAQVYPWIGQVSALLELKQYREAEIWSTRGLEQFPENASLLSQRARVLAATGNMKRAIGVSDYALSLGGNEWTWLARGEVLLHARDGNALSCLEKAVELAGPEDWRVPLLCGLCFMRHRQWSNAEAFLQMATVRNPRNAFAWTEYSRALMELNHTDRARDAIDRARQLAPTLKGVMDLEHRLYNRSVFSRVMGMFRR